MGRLSSNAKKRGIFFTFMAIMTMAIFIFIFTPSADISLQKNKQAVSARITAVDNYINNLENSYLKTVLRASSYKAILSLILYMNQTGKFLTNVNDSFYEAVLNGTIGSLNIDTITRQSIMENNTLTNWSEKISNVSRDVLNVNTTILIINATISQHEPWSIDSTLTVNYTITSDLATWKKTAVITSSLSIEGLYDPYYLVNTNGKYSNIILRSSVPFDKWTISEAREHLRNGTYMHWDTNDAPSFLNRFTNTIKPSDCCGIESLVNPNKLANPDVTDSYVDYLFWPHTFNAKCSELFNANGLWDEFSFFKLDLDHLTRYNITDKDAVPNCP